METSAALEKDLMNLLEQEAGLRVERVPPSSFEVISELLIWGTSIGAFGALWKALELFVKRYASARVTTKYTAADGTIVEMTRDMLTRNEAAAIASAHPPRKEDPVLVVVER